MIKNEEQLIKSLNPKSKFAQKWSDVKEGQKIRLVMYDELGFLSDREDWVECRVSFNGESEKPQLHDSDSCIWHDALLFPYEMELIP